MLAELVTAQVKTDHGIGGCVLIDNMRSAVATATDNTLSCDRRRPRRERRRITSALIISSEDEREPMRQGQQNRRGRGRNNNNNNNRKNQNPLTRSFESAGPDIKIRGNPSHIAEKYISLARDAQSSGDPVLAENYLQHAEHYNRIILTYREQQMSQSGGEQFHANANRQQGSVAAEAGSDDGADEDGDDVSSGVQAAHNVPGDGPQPSIGSSGRNENHRSSHRNGQHQGRGDRHRGNGNTQDASGGRRRDGNRDRRNERFQDRGGDQGRSTSMADDESNEQPAFLRRPIRRSRRSDNNDNGNNSPEVAAASEDQD